MRKLFFVGLLAVVLVPVPAFAQDNRAQGYLFVAPGGITVLGLTAASLHAGIGGEFFLAKGLAVGVEGGYLAPTRDIGLGLGIFSANGSYHFRNADKPRKLVPFVTAGYSLAAGQGEVGHMINFGGGVNWWMRDRLGLRFEARDHVTTDTPRGHFWQFRVALAFR